MRIIFNCTTMPSFCTTLCNQLQPVTPLDYTFSIPQTSRLSFFTCPTPSFNLPSHTSPFPSHCPHDPPPTMAGGHLKYRHLSRNSAHRQAMLRNMVTSLITHESIRTTWHKAKEAQRLAEKLITLGKKNTNAARRRASQILYVQPPLIPSSHLSCPTQQQQESQSK